MVKINMFEPYHGNGNGSKFFENIYVGLKCSNGYSDECTNVDGTIPMNDYFVVSSTLSNNENCSYIFWASLSTLSYEWIIGASCQIQRGIVCSLRERSA